MSTSSTPFSKWFMLLSIMLLSHGAMGQSNAMNTSIQSDPHFIGWYMGPLTTQALKDPETWTTSGNYARGCSKGACGYATDCLGNSITYDDGKTSSCNVCRTMTIFQSAPYASPSASNIFCAENWVAFTVFRELAVSTTSSESSAISTSSRTSVLSTTAPSTTGSSTNNSPTTAAPTVAVSTTATQAGDLQTVTGSKSSQSQGWIAGAVIGSVAATAIIAGLIGWFVYLRKKAQRLSVKEESITRQSLPYRQSTHKVPQEIYTASNPSTPFVHELSSYGYR
ncbi:hypothetical protein N7501_003370 [Penicillium viridicatum]|nr:hypothetical protein N7501_003370 [Penicillium viridicatum]